MLKTCSKCRQEKVSSDFHRYAASPDGRKHWCKNCTRAASKRYYDTPERRKATRAYELRVNFGLTTEQYDILLSEQGGTCAICRGRPTIRLCIDHDHTTGQIRGLLCGPCNLAVGSMKDDPTRLRLAAEYLEAVRA